VRLFPPPRDFLQGNNRRQHRFVGRVVLEEGGRLPFPSPLLWINDLALPRAAIDRRIG
jgi:hypothetical protein